MISHYLKVAVRNLLKYKVQYIITILCLVAGILCSSIVLHYLNQHSNPYKNLQNFERMVNFSFCLSDNNDERDLFLNDKLRIIEKSSFYGIELLAMTNGIDQKEEITFIDEQGKELDYLLYPRYVNNGLFTYYECTSLNNTDLRVNKGEVILSESCAKQIFGNKSPMGRKLFYTRQQKDKNELNYYTIVNVVKDLPHMYDKTFRIIGDIMFCYEDMKPEPTNMTLFGWLEKGKSLKEVNDALKSITFNSNGETSFLHARLLKDRYNNQQKDFTKWLLFLIASLVLIAALANFLKFSIQTFYNRVHELGLRKCLGSSQRQLFIILLMEVNIVLIMATLFTFASSELLIPYLHSFMSQNVYLLYKIDLAALWKIQGAILLYLSLFCTCMAWIATTRIRYVSVMSCVNNSIKKGKHSIRNCMMCFQLFICILFTGTSFGFSLIIYEVSKWSYAPISDEESKDIFRLKIMSSSRLYQNKDEIVSQIKALPGVAEVIQEGNSYFHYKAPDGREFSGTAATGDANYLSFFKIPVTGRKPVTNIHEVYISESFRKILEKDSVSGAVTLGDKTYQIAGTYPGLPFEQIHHPQTQTISAFFPTPEFNTICIKAMPGVRTKVRQSIEAVCRQYLPVTIPLEIETVYDYSNENKEGMTFLYNTASLLAILSLLITILGVYSAITLDTLGRQKEVAIRKTNGATPATIANLFGRLYLILLCIAFALAYPIVYLVINSIMNDMGIVYTNSFCWGLTVFLFVTLLVFITVGYKIYEVMKLNPADIIKNE